jgi:hypothetical protein
MRWGEEDDESDDGYGAPEGGGDDDWDAYAGLSCSSASAGPAVRAERTLTHRSSCAPPPPPDSRADFNNAGPRLSARPHLGPGIEGERFVANARCVSIRLCALGVVSVSAKQG